MYNFYIKGAEVLENNEVSIKIRQKIKNSTLCLDLLYSDIDKIPKDLGIAIKDIFDRYGG